MKAIFVSLKSYLHWMIIGGTFFFLAKILKDDWQGIISIQISSRGWIYLAIALGVTTIAHFWSGWVWLWTLQEFNQKIKNRLTLQAYLKTNVAKYLPGNVWHFYGRIQAITNQKVPLEIAVLSVLLEPLLMAASSCALAMANFNSSYWSLQVLGLALVLGLIHPRILNPIVGYMGKLKMKVKGKTEPSISIFRLQRYPLYPFLGEMGFVVLRGIGFILTIFAIRFVDLNQIPLLFTTFCLAWVAGLVVPGVPGGVGIFEATFIALLGNNHQFTLAQILGAVALYRLISVLSDISGAVIAWLDDFFLINQDVDP